MFGEIENLGNLILRNVRKYRDKYWKDKEKKI